MGKECLNLGARGEHLTESANVGVGDDFDGEGDAGNVSPECVLGGHGESLYVPECPVEDK